ncbi:MAG TPA: DUF928 domain-containing protein [Myxococcota bacterium]|nr:DUF928 domain-containing protein [Myxococcota bacterium]
MGRTALWAIGGVGLALALSAAAATAGETPDNSQQSPKTSEPVPATTPVQTPRSAKPIPPEKSTTPNPAVAAGIPVYVRPHGAAGGREGGGTRGGETAEIVALIPDNHAALTTREQPTLYWYLAEPTSARIDVIVNRGLEDQPLLEKTLQGPFSAGIHALDFKVLGIHLEPGSLYKWYVEVIPDPAHRSGDAFSGGTLQRIVPSTELDRSIGTAGPAERVLIYAQNGIWCDALDELSRQIAASPSDPVSTRQRVGLLEQVGLGPNVGVSEARPTMP